jgi:perosamine synthetase
MASDGLALLGGDAAVTSDWQPEWPYIDNQEISAVTDLLNRRVLSIYDRSGIIAEFENAFAEYHRPPCGESLYALSHNAGTSALHAAFFGLGIGPSDEVIVPTYTFLATVTPLLQCGATPVFADMSPTTLTIDPSSVLARINERTRAIVVTHMWGHPADMTAILSIAARYSLPVIEDCSHAHGATINGQKVGTFGVASCFSLEGHKAMTAGEGGILLTKSREIYERALLLGHFGRRVKDEVISDHLRQFIDTGFGHKFRMHPLAAAIALVQLRRLDERNEVRRQNLDLLSSLLGPIPGVQPPVTIPGFTRGGWYGYKAHYVSSDIGDLPMARYMEALRAEGVRVKRPGSPPLHRSSIFSLTRAEARTLALPWWHSLRESRPIQKECPIAESVYPTLLSLPTFSGPCEGIVRQYATAFEKVANRWSDLT